MNGKVQKERNSTLTDPDLLSVSFDIDPSLILIKDEHAHLAHYLKDRYLSIEIFDADSCFHYASCKIPLYELMRQ